MLSVLTLYISDETYTPKSNPNTHIIGHYNPSVRIIEQVYHNTYAVCVNFIDKHSLKSTSKDRDFHLLSEFFVRNLLSGSRRRNIFHIVTKRPNIV